MANQGETIGKVITCGHCEGKGRCYCRGCNLKYGVAMNDYCREVPCSVCGGAGSIWVGPQTVINSV